MDTFAAHSRGYRCHPPFEQPFNHHITKKNPSSPQSNDTAHTAHDDALGSVGAARHTAFTRLFVRDSAVHCPGEMLTERLSSEAADRR